MNNNAVQHNQAPVGAAQADVLARRERLSALADGQLDGADFQAALADAAGDEDGRATWAVYHLVGDALRSSDLARPSDAAFLARLRQQIAQEAPPARPVVAADVPAIVAAPLEPAANHAVFRWKMVAGFASLAAVAAIGWTSLSALQGMGPGAAPQLAAAVPERAPALAAAPAAPAGVVAVADGNGRQVMLRDPRLDELLAAHQQFGSTSALQMPAGFLRNATFETPGR